MEWPSLRNGICRTTAAHTVKRAYYKPNSCEHTDRIRPQLDAVGLVHTHLVSPGVLLRQARNARGK